MVLLPKVSIISVTLNSKESIEEAIKSVLNQTYKNIEYIIIDGGSTDGTLEVVDRYRHKINTLIAEKDNGVFDAMNKGLRVSSGEIIYFLNSDDVLYDIHIIEDAVDFFINNRETDFIYGDLEVLILFPVFLILRGILIKSQNGFLSARRLLNQRLFLDHLALRESESLILLIELPLIMNGI